MSLPNNIIYKGPQLLDKSERFKSILQYTYMFEADLIITLTIYVSHGVEKEKKNMNKWGYLTRHPKLLSLHGFKQFGNHWSMQMFHTVQSNVFMCQEILTRINFAQSDVVWGALV